MSVYVRAADEGDAYDWRGARVVVKASGDDTFGQLGVMAFRRAGSHPGQVFGIGAAAALAGLDEPAVAAALERLVDAMLVESPAPHRYRLHDLLRLFATERFAAEEAPGDRERCLARLLDWLTTHAEAGDWLAQERDNVLAAVRRGVESGEHERAWELVTAVHPLLVGRPSRPAGHVARRRGCGRGARRRPAPGPGPTLGLQLLPDSR